MSAYLSAVLADSPKHYWRAADPGGAVLQDIGSSYHIVFAPQSGIQLPYSGPVSDGGSTLINNNLAYWNLEGDNNSTPCSAEFWYWLPYNRGLTTALFDAEGASNSLLLVLLNTSNQLQLNAGTGHYTHTSDLARGSWHHIVATRDASTATLYADGSFLGSFSVAAQSTTATMFAIGMNTGGTQNSVGFMSEIAFYTAALTSGQVAGHYAAADQTALHPVYKANGIFDVITGSLIADPARLDAIYKAVTFTAY